MFSRSHSLKALLFCGVLAVGLPCTAFAALQVESKIGTDIKAVKTTQNLGMLFGWRYLHHASESFAVGGTAYTGQLSSGASGSFSYGGLVASYTSWKENLGFEFSLMGGGGGGFTNGSGSAGGIVIEPTLSLGANLGKSTRTSLNAGYIWLPNSSNFSGYALGLRFEFLTGDEPPAATPVAAK